MRRSRGVFLPPVAGVRVRRGTLHRALKGALLEGALTPGAKLPSSRQAAADYGVSRGLVEEVYSQLTDEGFLERTVGRGTFVARTVARVAPRAIAVSQARPAPSLSRRGRALASNAACREPSVFRPFNAGVADAVEFPWTTWQRLQARAARELGRSALTFADPRGLPRLRAAIAKYLAEFRGIRCEPEQIIVFNSAQQALHIVSTVLLNGGDRVWIEDPCYLGARSVIELARAAISAIPVDSDGLRVDVAVRRAGRARLAYVTPSNQYPTGVALSLERRLALLDWAAHGNRWVVEDDYDGEFRYEGQPLTPLYSLDSHARVLYIGTLNKSMFVSLRLAFIVVPRAFVEPLANVRTQFDGFTPPLRQLTMSLFMEEGHFSSHLRHMRAVYRAKRSALIEELTPLAALGWTWPSNPAGMHLLVRHQRGPYVRAVASASSLDLAMLSSYRHGPATGEGLFLRFGALDLSAIRSGAATLVKAAERIDRSSVHRPHSTAR